MFKTLIAAFAFAFALVAAVPAAAQAPRLTSLTDEIDAFIASTAAMPAPERVRAFRARFNALLPGFYEPRNGATEAQYDARIARALAAYPEQRDKFLAASRAFTAAYETATTRFRTFFPDYAPTMPIYLLHSLGEMDGGTRDLRGKTVAVFGADVIAKIHGDATIGPFLDHELFHFYHHSYFADCEPLWCSLWEEGLATYVAGRMNPGSDDAALMLTIPRPIRPEVERRLAEAMCGLRAQLDSTDRDVYAAYFYGSGKSDPFPPRYGYFLGYLLAKKIGDGRPLDELAKLSPAEVKPLLVAALAEYRCG